MITTQYDALGRVTRRILPQAGLFDAAHREAGATNPEALLTNVAQVTDTFYNSYGNAYKTSEYGIDATGRSVTQIKNTYTTYDKRGLAVAQFDVDKPMSKPPQR